jgi:hypothetical protein
LGTRNKGDEQDILAQSPRRVPSIPERESGLKVVDLKTNNLFSKAPFMEFKTTIDERNRMRENHNFRIKPLKLARAVLEYEM